jgi:hypothetical protein
MNHTRENTEFTDQYRENPDHGPVTSTGGLRRPGGNARGSGIKRFIDMLDYNLWLLSGLAVGIAALMITWWIVSGQGPGGTPLPAMLRHESSQTEAAVNPAIDRQDGPRRVDASGSPTIDRLQEQLTALNDRLEMLTDSIAYLESKLIRAHVLTDSIITAEQKHGASISAGQQVNTNAARFEENPPPAAAPGQTTGHTGLAGMPRQAPGELGTPGTGRVAGAQSNTGQRPRDATGTVAVTESRTSVSQKQSAINPAGGPWVINLSSSPSKADADRFAAKARSLGIETQQQQVSVKGKRYWRVQTAGFSTADEAQAYAGTVSGKLGLKDVWITKR